MDELDDTPVLISLAELKRLGGFVRWQDLSGRLAEGVEPGEPARGYPLFKTRLPPDPYVDLFLDPRWQRVQLVRRDEDRLVYLDNGAERSIAYDRYGVAPAGYFTDYRGEVGRPETAQLLDTFEVVHSGHRIKSWTIEEVAGPYVTFRVKSFDPGARWVDDSDMRRGNYTLHVADPRLKVEEVVSGEPLFNVSIAVSHRWLTPDEPDPEGAQFRELLQLCERLRLHDSQTFLLDFCSLPQRPRSAEQETYFRQHLAEFQRQFGRNVVVLNEGSHDYATRGWCMLELMLAALNDSMINHDRLDEGLLGAYQQAQVYMRHERWNQQNMLRAFGPRGLTNRSFGNFAADLANVAIYNESLTRRAEIVELFEKQLQVTDDRDIPIILELLRTLAFKEGGA